MNIATRDNLNLKYSQIPDVLDDVRYSRLSVGAKMTYAFLFNWYRRATQVHSDHLGEYISVARSVIAKGVGVCVKTAISYIKELVRCGLIRDRRLGVHMVNRISFYDVDEEFKYKRKEDKEESNTNDSSATNEPAATKVVEVENNGDISNVKKIVFEAFEEKISTKDAKALLIASDSNFKEIEEAIKYNVGKPYDNLVAKLCDSINNRYWNKPKLIKELASPATEVKPKPPNKNKKSNKGKFATILSHDWNLNKLEAYEYLYGMRSVGEITQEEYDELCSELEK